MKKTLLLSLLLIISTHLYAAEANSLTEEETAKIPVTYPTLSTLLSKANPSSFIKCYQKK